MQSSASVDSLMSPEKKKEIDRNYSDETFYTDSSEEVRSKCKSAATLLQKRHQLRPINGSGNPYVSSTRLTALASASKNNVSLITQKIMSAKLLRVKQLQNELTDAHFQLNELSTENRILRTLQKRQDMALKKYEGTQAELPQLIRSHNEEVRALKAKVKQLKTQYRELENRLKVREGELAALREQHKHLLKLSKDKHLGEREQLQQQLEQMQDLLKEQDKKVQMLTRKSLLEGKNFKHQLTTEVAHHKKTTKELDIALERVAQLESVLEAKEKYIAVNMGRNHSFHPSPLVSFAQSQSRFRLYPQAGERPGASEGGASLCEAERERGDPQGNGGDGDVSGKAHAHARPPRPQRTLQRQSGQMAADDDDDDEEEDFEQPLLSESIGSNTCPSQISTAESVENLSKDTTDNCREDELKSELNSRETAGKYTEYGADAQESSQKTLKLDALQALRRYSISGDNFVNEEPQQRSSRRGSLNGAGDSKKKDLDPLSSFESRDFSRKAINFHSQKAGSDVDQFPSDVHKIHEDKTSRKKCDDRNERKMSGSADLTDMTVEEGRLHLKSINRTWNEIQNRIKDETIRAQSMIEKYDEEREDIGKFMSRARRTDTYDKNNLLAALKAIDEGSDLDFSDAMERRNTSLQCKSKKVEYRTPSHVVEKLHRGIPTRNSVSASMLEKPRKEHNIYWDDDTNEPTNMFSDDIGVSKTQENITQAYYGNQQ